MNKPEYIIVHHTGGTDANPKADTSHHTAYMIKQWHLAKGWQDIGYNWVIEKDGKIVKGRDEKIDGAHTIGYNSKSIGICLSGNFDVTYPTKEQEVSLAQLVREVMGRYPSISLVNIVPHRKFANKSCYGSLLKDDWVVKLVESNKPEIKDGSAECKTYLEKQDKITIASFLTYLIQLFTKK